MMLARDGGRHCPRPTGYGNSPYQSDVSFAGNAVLISPPAVLRRAVAAKM